MEPPVRRILLVFAAVSWLVTPPSEGRDGSDWARGDSASHSHAVK